MRRVIQGHLCSTETARKVAENAEVEIYKNRAGFYFAFYPKTRNIELLTGERVEQFLNKLPHDELELRGIKALRKAAGLTQQQLADAAGLDIRNLQRYECGEFLTENMGLAVAVKIADALGVDVKKLL